MTTIHIAQTLKEALTKAHADLPDASQILFVSDCNTWDAVSSALSARDTLHHHQFHTPPKATISNANKIRDAAHDCKAGMVIAVGSGTINDLCKYAAYTLNIPYLVIATAPSMNGYISPNASLVDQHIKQTFPVRAPLACITGLDVLQHAPKRLIASGIGDTLCNSSIRYDIALSRQVGYDIHADEAITHAEQYLIKTLVQHQPGALFDNTLIHALFDALIVSGRAMAEAGSSAPASQCEHAMAHLLELLSPALASDYFHGEVIAVTSLYTRRRQEQFSGCPAWQPPVYPHADIEQHFGTQTAIDWQSAYTIKQARLGADARPIHPVDSQPLFTAVKLEHLLSLAGCPTHAADLGITEDQLKHAARFAPFSRNRFGILDVVYQ